MSEFLDILEPDFTRYFILSNTETWQWKQNFLHIIGVESDLEKLDDLLKATLQIDKIETQSYLVPSLVLIIFTRTSLIELCI